jgi:transcriptional antiterminator Rof (Rho-off)
MNSDYQPVACSFYDELGLRMMRGRPCVLVIDGEEGPETIETILRDIYSEGDAEFARLDDGTRIRLDRIRHVDDVARPDARGPG